jgi:hypothetical protein
VKAAAWFAGGVVAGLLLAAVGVVVRRVCSDDPDPQEMT